MEDALGGCRYAPAMRALALGLSLAVISLGCGGSDDHPAPLTSSAGAAGSGAAGSGGGAGLGGAAGGATGPLVVAPTMGDLPLTFTFAAKGSGTKKVGAIDLAADVGTVAFGGTTYAAVVYEHQPWPSQGYDLFQVLAVGEDRIFVAWMYCQSGALTYVYFEGTDGTKVQYEPAAAGSTCAFTDQATTAKVSLPAVSMPVPVDATGFSATMTQLTLPQGGPGTLALGGTKLTVFPFNTVDCTKDCGTPGWWEMHSLLWDPTSSRLCFAIFYFEPGKTGGQVTYALTLPVLSDPVGTLALDGAWQKN